jgi:hypothetical protein
MHGKHGWHSDHLPLLGNIPVSDLGLHIQKRRGKTTQAVKTTPQINKGKGATLVPNQTIDEREVNIEPKRLT